MWWFRRTCLPNKLCCWIVWQTWFYHKCWQTCLATSTLLPDWTSGIPFWLDCYDCHPFFFWSVKAMYIQSSTSYSIQTGYYCTIYWQVGSFQTGLYTCAPLKYLSTNETTMLLFHYQNQLKCKSNGGKTMSFMYVAMSFFILLNMLSNLMPPTPAGVAFNIDCTAYEEIQYHINYRDLTGAQFVCKHSVTNFRTLTSNSNVTILLQ